MPKGKKIVMPMRYKTRSATNGELYDRGQCKACAACSHYRKNEMVTIHYEGCPKKCVVYMNHKPNCVWMGTYLKPMFCDCNKYPRYLQLN